MLKQLIIVWFVVAAAIAITAWLLPSVEVDGGPVRSSCLPSCSVWSTP